MQKISPTNYGEQVNNELSETFETNLVYITVPQNKTFYLIPFGDVHYGSELCAEDRFDEFCEWAKGKPDAFFLGMGDYMDMFSLSERKALMGNLHESSLETLEIYYKKKLDKFYEKIKWMEGRCWGLIEGNHTLRFESGETATQYLCRKLKCKYLGNAAFVKVRVMFNNRGNKDKKPLAHALTIFAAHGLGSTARTTVGGMTAVERMEPICDADLYLQGHNHAKGALPFSRMYLVDTNDRLKPLKIIQRKGFYVRTGSFLRGYVPGHKSYIANRLYRPCDLGVCKIEITPKRSRVDGHDTNYLDIHVSV